MTRYVVIDWSDEATGIRVIRSIGVLNFPEGVECEVGAVDSLAEAATRMTNASDFVIAVEGKVPRALTKTEKQELQALLVARTKVS